MIDLTAVYMGGARLPEYVECDGALYRIDTDFRTWIQFGDALGSGDDISFVFEADIPEDGYEEALIEFYTSPPATPNGGGYSSDRAFDLVLDGDYIYASFMQAYGIDLVDTGYMHWHKFLALFNSLPDDTKMSQIMGFRTWKKSNEKHETVMARLKSAWALPVERELTPEEEEFQAQFLP